MYERYKPVRQLKHKGFWEWLEKKNENIMVNRGMDKFKTMMQDHTTNGIACSRIYNELYSNALVSLRAMKKTKGDITTLFNTKKLASTIAMLLASKLVEHLEDGEARPIILSQIVNNNYADQNDAGLMQLLNLHDFVGNVITMDTENFYGASLHYTADHEQYSNRELSKDDRAALHQKLVNDITNTKTAEYKDYVYKFFYSVNLMLEHFGVVNTSNVNNNAEWFSISDLNLQYYRMMIDAISKHYTSDNKTDVMYFIDMMLTKLEYVIKNESIPCVFEAKKYNPKSFEVGLTSLLGGYDEFSLLVDGFYFKERWMINEVQTWLDSIINETLTTTKNNKVTKNQYVDIELVDNTKTIALSQYAKRYFDMEQIDQHKHIAPYNFAMCVKPLDWSLVDRATPVPKHYGLPESTHTLNHGGYITDKAHRPLIPRLRPDYEPPSERYLHGINKAQSTAFNINMRMLKRIEQIGYIYSPTAKVDIFKTYKQRPKNWTNERWARYKTSNASKNFQSNEIIKYAKMYMNWDNIYFPMYGDNRGRGYYVPPYLSPQTTDIGKSLLVFATTRTALTADDKNKYKILISGLCGYDKKSIKNRYKWFDKHESMIVCLGNDIMDKDTMDFFCGSDNPWQTLAACYDYVEFLNDINTKGEHLSFIYGGKDGKCNGSQHWATILRDELGASKVGIAALTENDDPDDVYNSVGENLLKLIKNDINNNADIHEIERLLERPLKRVYSAETSCAMGNEWYNAITKEKDNTYIIDRSFVKRPTMTSTYSAGQKAFKNFVKNYTIDNGVTLKSTNAKGVAVELNRVDTTKYIAYISKYLQYAIDMTVKLRNGMMYVQECVKRRLELLEKPIAPLHYTSAIGFHVYLDDISTYKVITRAYNKKTQRYTKLTLKHRNDIGVVMYDYLKFSTAIAPDFIHSNDASHMFMTVTAATEIKNWALVHDDYATSLCDWDMLEYHIKEEFITLYDDPERLLVNFQNEVLDVSGGLIEQPTNIEPIELPTLGTLDINVIRQSPYFFI